LGSDEQTLAGFVFVVRQIGTPGTVLRMFRMCRQLASMLKVDNLTLWP
jgi:hypothetical protein